MKIILDKNKRDDQPRSILKIINNFTSYQYQLMKLQASLIDIFIIINNIYQMWIQSQIGQTLCSQNTDITILKNAYQIEPQHIHITAHPFQATNQRSLSLDLPSEAYKNMQSAQKIISFLSQIRANRSSTVDIKGGGLLLDLAGFSCSIYMRGIKNVNYIPTTLLAMVDATVGGKTAINFAGAKNIVGTIKPPNKVFIDLSTLKTLPKRQFNSGLAQVIKIALTHDADFFAYLQSIALQKLTEDEMSEHLRRIVKRSLQLKLGVVERDLYQKNQRKWLNFGHTIGHGIQLLSLNQYLHGQCVAIGIIQCLKLSLQRKILKNQGLIERVIKIFKRLNLPVNIPQNNNITQMTKMMLKDKKNTSKSQQIQFVMIQNVGVRCQNTTKISKKQIQWYFTKQVQIGKAISIHKNIVNQFKFPASKSVSLRYIYMAALSILRFKKSVKVMNVLFSDDTLCMILSLQQLGFEIVRNQLEGYLQIKKYSTKEQGTLFIGNSGLTARFILPLCSSLKGNWHITCHPRMSERPNQQIIELCLNLFDCQIVFQKQKNCFPLIVKTSQTNLGLKKAQISIKTEKSSQFVSSLMLYAAYFNKRLDIVTQAGKLVSQSYLRMTAKCLEQCWAQILFMDGKIIVQSYYLRYIDTFQVQTDLSSLSYPYVFSLFHNIAPPALPYPSMQGDVVFYQYLQDIKNSKNQKMNLSFNLCTDTFMTMAVFCLSQQVINSPLKKLTIFDIANQRIKQSNRIALVIKNMKKIGVFVEESQNSITIHIKKQLQLNQSQTIVFETDGDHRIAMSFAILSSFLKIKYPTVQFVIDDKKAVNKTFPTFWKFMQQAGVPLSAPKKFAQFKLPLMPSQKIILIGDRGSGKTTFGQYIASKLNTSFRDLDQIVTEQLNNRGILSISQCIQIHGWAYFRILQQNTLQQFIANNTQKSFVMATGAGIIQNQTNRLLLSSTKMTFVWLQRQYSHLRILQTSHRPTINNYQQVSRQRRKHYQSCASVIITVPFKAEKEKEQLFVWKRLQQHLMDRAQMKQGMILVNQDIPDTFQSLQVDKEDISSIEFRVDGLIEKGQSLSNIRKKISTFKANSEIDTILTLRTQAQFGSFTGNYLKTMQEIIKIPTSFLDHQLMYPIEYKYPQSRLVLSYHGSHKPTIQKLINIQHFKGMKKLCISDQGDWQGYMKRLGQKNICVSLLNPISRIHNKRQFVVRQQPLNNKTGIFSIKNMKILNSLKHLLLKK